MTTRYDKLIIVRRVASRLASAALAGAAARVATHQAVVRRLDDAACELTPETGLGLGAALGARHELAARMQTARRRAQAKANDACADRDNAVLARQSARRALDAAIDVQRADRKAQAARRTENTALVIIKDRLK